MNIYFFGDSICVGQFVSPIYTWVNLLTRELENHLGSNVLVQNPSVNGRTTRQALENMSFQIQVNPVDVLYIQFGLNDCNCWASDNGCPRVRKEAFRENLTEIISKAKKSGVQICFLGTNHPTIKTGNGLDFSYQQTNVEYNKIIRHVSELTSTTLIDHEHYWFSKYQKHNESIEKLLLLDGIHLSKQGHALYADCAKTVLISQLQTNFPMERYHVKNKNGFILE